MRVAVHAGQVLQPVPGGIGRYVSHLLAALPEVDVDPVPFGAGTPTNPPPGWRDLGWPGIPWRYELWHRVRWLPLRVPGELVHATSLAVPPAGNRPLVVTVHDLVFDHYPEYLTRRGVSFHRRGMSLARREAAAIITPSAYEKNELVERGFAPDRVHVAWHGVEVLSEHTPRPNFPYVLFVGTIEPRKGLDTLLDAIAGLRAQGHPDLRLVVAGQRGWGAPPALLDSAWVRPMNGVDDATLDGLYRGAIALALPSRYEGFGMPVVEAMARGCPVVTSTAACLPEIVGDAGVLVPPDDVDALASSLAELLGDEKRRLDLAARGSARAQLFTWRASAEAHAAAYRAALA